MFAVRMRTAEGKISIYSCVSLLSLIYFPLFVSPKQVEPADGGSTKTRGAPLFLFDGAFWPLLLPVPPCTPLISRFFADSLYALNRESEKYTDSDSEAGPLFSDKMLHMKTPHVQMHGVESRMRIAFAELGAGVDCAPWLLQYILF